MELREFLQPFKGDGFIQSIAETMKPNEGQHVQVKGLVGSLDAVLGSTVQFLNHQFQVFILPDKEEAAYFFNDLQNLNPGKEILFFPTSYKRPYQFEEIENANILLRSELLNKINQRSSSGEMIVTYPDALTEKVINKRSLTKNTFTLKISENLDIEFLTELLIGYDFEKTDFVYEPGQFAVRGGIVDIFSFSTDLPYRIEFFGDEVESIRSFDPNTQLSIENKKSLSLIPNVQTKLLEEERQSFLEYIPSNSKIWMKDVQQAIDIIDNYFQKATDEFDKILDNSAQTHTVLKPQELFDSSESFRKKLKDHTTIEFGNRFVLKTTNIFQFNAEAQPAFNKNFDLIAKDFDKWQDANHSNIISAENHTQLQRLQDIFIEIDPLMKFNGLVTGLRSGFIEKDLKITCYTDHQLFERFHRYKTKDKSSKSKALTLKELKTLQAGDFVTHIDYGVGRFAGLDKVDVGGNQQEAIRLIFKDDDLLYVGIHSIHKISKFSGKEGTPPSISKLGSPEWENKKKKVKRQVKDIAKDLIQLYAKRKAAPGFAYPKDDYMQIELESSFIYEDTPDQATATEDAKKDMELAHPMDRLVCGDVGFGKTEVAIRAAFKAVNNGKQVAVLVPTTILAMQHNRTFRERLSNFPIDIDYINRFKTTAQVKETVQKVKEGKIDILIGTHRIVSKDLSFKDLGLLIIDEEQKFGVKVKEKLKELRVNVDVLTLTATPIPRTLHFSLMGARDLSVISTPPPNRQPVTTELHFFDESTIRDAISFELRRGGQVFFVHNRVNDIEEVANIILRLVPDAQIGVAHGQMEGSRLEKVMMRFIEGEYDVLISTNIIESGLDIPNANTIIINHAHMFGMSDLHQMRGRVGRSNKKAFCYLLSPPTSVLTSEARKRLQAMEEFSELGDGFKVAMRDLDIRGAGNLLGQEQSGFISDLGFDMYHKILDEAIQELKETDFKDLFKDDLKKIAKALVQDCNLETDLELIIPEDYVTNISERLSLYSQLDNLKNEEELNTFTKSLEDRFGPIPEPTRELIKSMRLRWLAISLGFEKLSLKNGAMRCYFPHQENEAYYKSEVFGKLMSYIQLHPDIFQLKERKEKLILVASNVSNIDAAFEKLNSMDAAPGDKKTALNTIS
ncbi:MAG: transcription-repair coupling factor [Cyclobacteriaceae bacterium]